MRLDHLLSKERNLNHCGLGVPKLNTGYSAPITRDQMHIPPSVPSGSVARTALNRLCVKSGPHSSVLRERPSGLLHCERWRIASLFALRTPLGRTSPGVECVEVSFENSRASTSIFFKSNNQATKSQRWMPWRLEPKKDVGDCEKPRGAVYQASIRGCPNGETQHPSWGVTPA